MREEKCINEEEQAQIDIWKYVFGFTEMAVVKCAVELGIPDFMESHEGPITLDHLSSSLGCTPSALYRIMRFLTGRNIFKEVNTKTYAQTPLSRLLVKSSEKSMTDVLLLESSPVMLDPWHYLSAGSLVANGVPPFQAAHGDDLWHYAKKNPSHSKLINDALACIARTAVSAITDGCPEVFNEINSLVDVGGGNGTTLGNIIKAYPRIRGLNFDLPHVVSVAPNWPGVENIEGDMFKCVPKADAAFIMSVLHDWSDEECIQILKNCKEAIPQDKGKVVIVEVVIDREGKNKLKDVGLVLDMIMMAHTTTGKERTSEEWANVISAAGFSRYTVKHIRTFQSVIEIYP